MAEKRHHLCSWGTNMFYFFFFYLKSFLLGPVSRHIKCTWNSLALSNWTNSSQLYRYTHQVSLYQCRNSTWKQSFKITSTSLFSLPNLLDFPQKLQRLILCNFCWNFINVSLKEKDQVVYNERLTSYHSVLDLFWLTFC